MQFHVLYKDSPDNLQSNSVVLEAGNWRHLTEIMNQALPLATILNVSTQEFVDYKAERAKITPEIEYLSAVVLPDAEREKFSYKRRGIGDKIRALLANLR